jgi:16S rRNA (cytosine967-C5)-methyltransferase
VLWVALHELTELGHPPHAVVDEAVRASVELGQGHARGFVNGLLRGVAREGIEDDFPDPSDARSFAETWHSHPRWLVDRWADRLGEAEMLGLCAANNERPRLYLRSMPRRREMLAAALDALEWQTEAVDDLPDALELLTRVPPALLLEQVEEPCVLQDAAAQLVAPLLAGERPVRVLDLCAAPGGKATHLASLLPDATVCAVDLSLSRTIRLLQGVDRFGAGGRVAAVVADGGNAPFREGFFDAVLLDAPCTGTGVLARRHDARWIRDVDDVKELRGIQRVLLESALDLVRPGGVVLYATCSLEAEENDEVVDFVLGRREDVREWPLTDEVPERFIRDGRLATWPHRHGIDGAFAARLRKLSPDGKASA